MVLPDSCLANNKAFSGRLARQLYDHEGQGHGLIIDVETSAAWPQRALNRI